MHEGENFLNAKRIDLQFHFWLENRKNYKSKNYKHESFGIQKKIACIRKKNKQ